MELEPKSNLVATVESNYVYAKVLGEAGRYVRVENPTDGAVIRVSGDDRLLKRTEVGSWLLISHEFLETAILGNSAGVHTDNDKEILGEGFFDKQVFGIARGNVIALLIALGAIGGMVLWSHHWH
jgi:hypothetical protein